MSVWNVEEWLYQPNTWCTLTDCQDVAAPAFFLLSRLPSDREGRAIVGRSIGQGREDGVDGGGQGQVRQGIQGCGRGVGMLAEEPSRLPGELA